MSADELENALRDLPRIGRKIEDQIDRQIWSFEFADNAYTLQFFPRHPSALKRLRGNPALKALANYQTLQKANVASPRAVSAMVGFRLGEKIGDALLLLRGKPTTSLKAALEDSPSMRNRRTILLGVISILKQLAAAGLGQNELRLENFSITGAAVQLSESRGLNRRGLRLDDLFHLEDSASRFLSNADRLRVWRAIGPDRPLPKSNPVSQRKLKSRLRQTCGNNKFFGRISIGRWTGAFTRGIEFSYEWSRASSTQIHEADWKIAWPKLLSALECGNVELIKRGESGDVSGATIQLAGKSIDVIIKQPRRKFWWRYLTEIGRGSRAQRTWNKTWKMLLRNVPCEWPMLVMERKRFGWPIESILVFEKVPGSTLAAMDLETLRPRDREMLFFRTGRALRQIEQLGFTHADAKSANWIVFQKPDEMPKPILIDLDGVRHYRWSLLGMERLLRAMKQHPQYTPADSFWLCRGFAPWAKLQVEPATPTAENLP